MDTDKHTPYDPDYDLHVLAKSKGVDFPSAEADYLVDIMLMFRTNYLSVKPKKKLPKQTSKELVQRTIAHIKLTDLGFTTNEIAEILQITKQSMAGYLTKHQIRTILPDVANAMLMLMPYMPDEGQQVSMPATVVHPSPHQPDGTVAVTTLVRPENTTVVSNTSGFTPMVRMMDATVRREENKVIASDIVVEKLKAEKEAMTGIEMAHLVKSIH